MSDDATLTPDDWRALYALLSNQQGVRRKDIALLLQQRYPSKPAQMAAHEAGVLLTALHTLGAVFRNEWYYVLTEKGRLLKEALEE
jgi:Mn-dependent DtxR family transcriptional regulator